MGTERQVYLHEAFDWKDMRTRLVFVGHGLVTGCVAGLMAITCHVGALLLASDQQELVALGLLLPVFTVPLFILMLLGRAGREKAVQVSDFLIKSDLNITIAHEKSVGLIILWIFIIYGAMWMAYSGFVQFLDDQEKLEGLFIGAVLLTVTFPASLQNALARWARRATDGGIQTHAVDGPPTAQF